MNSCERFAEQRDAEMSPEEVEGYLETAGRFMEACQKAADDLG